MSIHVMTQVWKRAQYTGGELLVLLALADWADDEGKCFPSLVAVAEKARLSKRQVCRLIAKFREDGVLSGDPGKGRGHRTQYQINSDKMSPFPSKKKSDADVTQKKKEKVTSGTVKGDICDNPPAPPNRRTVRNRQLNTNTPLPPSQASGECERVMLACGFTDKRVGKAIAEVLAAELARGEPEADTATLMIENWRWYVIEAEFLRYTWNPRKFFAQGFWKKQSLWPYDQARIERIQNANVGRMR